MDLPGIEPKSQDCQPRILPLNYKPLELKTIIYFIVFFISYELYSNEKFILPKKHLNKQYSFLSCKVDSLYYALQYYIDDLPNEEWFINQIPIKKNKVARSTPPEVSITQGIYSSLVISSRYFKP